MVEWVLEIVRLYSDEPSPATLRELLGMTSGAMRAIAFASLPLEHPDRPAFKALLDDIAASRNDGVSIRGAFYSVEDLAEAEARISRHPDGTIDLLFPVRHPWMERPDPDAGFAGTRADPIYRSTAERQALDALQAERQRPAVDRPWWMPDNYQGPVLGDDGKPTLAIPVQPVPDDDIPW